MQVFVLGAGTFAQEVTDLLADLGHEVAAYLVTVDGQPSELLGRPVLQLGELEPRAGALAVGIAKPLRWAAFEQARAAGWALMRVVHPSASVSRTASLGPGAVVNRGAVIAAHAVLHEDVMVNRGVTVGHHCTLEPHVTLGPGAHLAGMVRVCGGAFVGMGAVVREGLSVGPGATVGMGAVVTRSVYPGATVLGSPARVMEEGPE